MAKIDTLKIVLAVNAIALLLTEDDYQKVKPYLFDICDEVKRASEQEEVKQDD